MLTEATWAIRMTYHSRPPLGRLGAGLSVGCWGLWSNLAGAPRNKGEPVRLLSRSPATPSKTPSWMLGLKSSVPVLAWLAPSPKPGLARGQRWGEGCVLT